MAIPDLLELAGEAADLSTDRTRRAYVGAVAVRQDGAIVQSRNGSSKKPDGTCHAEARVLRKAGFGSTVYVSRLLKNGKYAMAKPCKSCEARLRSKGVRLVVFTTGADEWAMQRL